MPEIHITTPCVINEITILPIPNNMSKKFTSRSQVMIKGMIGGVSFHGPAEPDGRGGHWIDATDLPSITANESVEINLQQSHDLPEPTMPHEFTDMLASSPAGKATWDKKLRRWRTGNGSAGPRVQKIPIPTPSASMCRATDPKRHAPPLLLQSLVMHHSCSCKKWNTHQLR